MSHIRNQWEAQKEIGNKSTSKTRHSRSNQSRKRISPRESRVRAVVAYLEAAQNNMAQIQHQLEPGNARLIAIFRWDGKICRHLEQIVNTRSHGKVASDQSVSVQSEILVLRSLRINDLQIEIVNLVAFSINYGKSYEFKYCKISIFITQFSLNTRKIPKKVFSQPTTVLLDPKN